MQRPEDHRRTPEGASQSPSPVAADDDRPPIIGTVLWLTGLPCSGKSTLASGVSERLRASGHRVELLDGDRVRRELSPELGFSRDDRIEQARRVGRAAAAAVEGGAIVVVAVIAPVEEARAAARAALGSAYVEVHVDAPVEVCEARDVKGMYARARAGSLPNFTGVSAPYEPPARPHLRIRSDLEEPGASIERLLVLLAERGIANSSS